MAQRTTVVMVDDLDGSEFEDTAGETIHYSLDGAQYEIDLHKKNAEKFRKQLEPWLDVSRKSTSRGAPTRQPKRSSGGSDVDPKAVRAWAAAKGIDINARGRISAEIVEQYKAAGN